MTIQTIQLGETAIDIPTSLDWRDDEGTLVAYLPGTDFANLRFTLLSIRERSGDLVPRGGLRAVMNRCIESKGTLKKSGETVWFYWAEPASEGSEGSLMHYWYAGLDAHMLIISCFVDAEMKQSEDADIVLSSVERTIGSFRKYPAP